MSKEQEQKLFEMGGKLMGQVLDEQIGVIGTPERDRYESDLKLELTKRFKAIEAKYADKFNHIC